MAANSESGGAGGQDQSKKVELVQENGKVYRKWTDADGITHYKQLGIVEGAQAQTSEGYKKSREKAQAEIQQGVKKVQDLFTDLFNGLPRHREFGESQKPEWSPPESGSINSSQEDGYLAKFKKKINQGVSRQKEKLGKQTHIVSEDAEAIKETEEYFKQLKEKSGDS